MKREIVPESDKARGKTKKVGQSDKDREVSGGGRQGREVARN